MTQARQLREAHTLEDLRDAILMRVVDKVTWAQISAVTRVPQRTLHRYVVDLQSRYRKYVGECPPNLSEEENNSLYEALSEDTVFKKHGGSSVKLFTKEQEDIIVSAITMHAICGYPLSLVKIQSMMYETLTHSQRVKIDPHNKKPTVISIKTALR